VAKGRNGANDNAGSGRSLTAYVAEFMTRTRAADIPADVMHLGKFSMEFCMAILLIERKAGLTEFTDRVVNRRDVQKLIGKIEFGVHPEAEAAGYEKMTTIIDIELADGRRISGRADFGKGSPANPMSDEELSGKFRECAAWGKLPKANAGKVVDMVFNLEKLKSIRELTRLLAIGTNSRLARHTRKR